MIGGPVLWAVIAALGVGTFLIRYSFLGLIGDRKMPEWVLRHLRYTPVAVLPGLVAPLVLWPAATEGETDPARLIAALVALGAGWLGRSAVWAMVAGALALYAGLWLEGAAGW
ncbi:AzlD domain-containing protein [Pseudoroseicyclus tamaricis]|uniref:AzlD domain-containing protein n=1 Tax=Pseudoroseicyclus tamaricis TaxID=2705421 RepID=A0A6B2JVN3_9RHOB|nr:AzlD domain-containing protein [Pseudoroseicyclus tamaricis]NDU99451.1 AzlD domain-containing protein [Pseudoroseicyclus tamaricis]